MILEKLENYLTLTVTLQVHPDILPYTEECVRKSGVRTLSQLEQLYNKEVRM